MATTAASSAVQPRKRGWVRWLKRILLAAVILVVLLIAIGVVREQVNSRADAKRFPRRGQLVDVGGFRMNIDCSGSAAPGVPTVILESGGGVPGYGWNLVQPGIAKFTRVCSYDRAGYGWSDAPLEEKRTSSQVVRELHALLKNASIPPPYVLVGHSLGGYNIRVYNKEYPQEVGGAVFVDSSHEDQLERMTPALKQMMESQTKGLAWKIALYRLAIQTGVMRSFQHSARRPDGLPPDFVEEVEYLQRKDAFVVTTFGEIKAFSESANEVRESGDFGDKPVVVLTAGKAVDVPGIPKADFAAFQQIWIHELQPQIARLSTRGKQIVVQNSDHMIPMQQPQTVVAAAQEVLTAIAASEPK